jgi:hypothetical protein
MVATRRERRRNGNSFPMMHKITFDANCHVFSQLCNNSLVILSAKSCGGILNPSMDVLLLNLLSICSGADFYIILLSLIVSLWKSNSCGIALLQK